MLIAAATSHQWYTSRPVKIVAVVVAAIVLVRLINLIVERAYWGRLSAGQTPEHITELRRNQRQQTVVTMLHSLVRYVVYDAAIAMSVFLVSAQAASTLLGASLLVVVVGFGLQRVLADAVAGALLLFEGHYAVGDYIKVHQLGVEGVVEQFTVRSTVLRAISGDRVVVMNSSITACTRFAQASRDIRVEFMVAGNADAIRVDVQRVLDQATESPNRRFLFGPEQVATNPVEHAAADDVYRMTLRAVVPPTQEWLVESWLVEQLERTLGDHLMGSIDVIDISDTAIDSLQGAALIAAN